MAFLELSGIEKRYPGEPEPCLRGLDMSLQRGKIAVLLGASGCGKTTVLKIIAGLEGQDAGTVRIDGEDMDGISPEKRPLSMVFQKALMFSGMTVEQNVNFAPRVNRSLPKRQLAEKTEQMLALVGMEGMGAKRASELSGGQEQRVSLARALMVEPKLLLLDEPLSALDAALRETMQGHIRHINRKTGVTMVMVTHDQREAVAVADEIAVMHEGRILQVAEPGEFYRRPRSRYVASFFGWRNFVPAVRSAAAVECALGTFPVQMPGAPVGAGLLAVRPEAACNIGAGRIRATVADLVPEGLGVRYRMDCGGCELVLTVAGPCAFRAGEQVSFDLDPSLLWFVEDDGSV